MSMSMCMGHEQIERWDICAGWNTESGCIICVCVVEAEAISDAFLSEAISDAISLISAANGESSAEIARAVAAR